MQFSSFLGLTGTLIDLVRATPQLIRLFRSRNSFGVSADAMSTSCIVSIGWTIYGLLTHQPYVILASGIMASIFLMITVMALRLGRSMRELRVAPIWLGVLTLAGSILGKYGLGAALSVSALASNIPQIRVAYGEKDLTGLSLGTWLLSFSGGLAWGLYGALQQDVSILVSAVFQSTTSCIIIVLKLSRRFKSDATTKEMS